MSDILNKNIVLVLNRNWQAINIRISGQPSVAEGNPVCGDGSPDPVARLKARFVIKDSDTSLRGAA